MQLHCDVSRGASYRLGNMMTNFEDVASAPHQAELCAAKSTVSGKLGRQDEMLEHCKRHARQSAAVEQSLQLASCNDASQQPGQKLLLRMLPVMQCPACQLISRGIYQGRRQLS